MKKLDYLLEELEETWDYTPEEIRDIREKVLSFALDIFDDPSLYEELLLERHGEVDDGKIIEFPIPFRPQW